MSHTSTAFVLTSEAPEPIGPYSQGMRCGDFLFTAGQVGLTPSDGIMVEGGVAEQTRRALENLKGVLVAGGASLENVVKTTIFLRDMNDFAAMNAIYAEYFSESGPARSTVAVVGLPKDALVEIEAIAFISGAPLQ